jgi:hypothetical protein
MIILIKKYGHLRRRLLNELNDSKENYELYEMIINRMAWISVIFKTEIMQYNEEQLYDRCRSTIATLPHYELNRNLLEILDFFP